MNALLIVLWLIYIALPNSNDSKSNTTTGVPVEESNKMQVGDRHVNRAD